MSPQTVHYPNGVSLVLHEPDPVLAPDAGQFFTAILLDHEETCSEEGCEQNTRLAVRFEDSDDSHHLMPYCKDHVHLLFADWMVGA